MQFIAVASIMTNLLFKIYSAPTLKSKKTSIKLNELKHTQFLDF